MEQKCVCFPRDLGCAAKGSDKYRTLAKLAADLDAKEAADRVAAAKRDQDAQVAVAKRYKVARAATAKLRAAYWACANDPASPGCVAQAEALEAACEKQGLRFLSISVTHDCHKP